MPSLDPFKPPHMEEAPSDLIPIEKLYEFYLEGYTAGQELNNKHRELLANAPTREEKDKIFRMLMEEKSASQQHAMNLGSRLSRSLQWHNQETKRKYGTNFDKSNPPPEVIALQNYGIKQQLHRLNNIQQQQQMPSIDPNAPAWKQELFKMDMELQAERMAGRQTLHEKLNMPRRISPGERIAHLNNLLDAPGNRQEIEQAHKDMLMNEVRNSEYYNPVFDMTSPDFDPQIAQWEKNKIVNTYNVEEKGRLENMQKVQDQIRFENDPNYRPRSTMGGGFSFIPLPTNAEEEATYKERVGNAVKNNKITFPQIINNRPLYNDKPIPAGYRVGYNGGPPIPQSWVYSVDNPTPPGYERFDGTTLKRGGLRPIEGYEFEADQEIVKQNTPTLNRAPQSILDRDYQKYQAGIEQAREELAKTEQQQMELFSKPAPANIAEKEATSPPVTVGPDKRTETVREPVVSTTTPKTEILRPRPNESESITKVPNPALVNRPEVTDPVGTKSADTFDVPQYEFSGLSLIPRRSHYAQATVK